VLASFLLAAFPIKSRKPPNFSATLTKQKPEYAWKWRDFDNYFWFSSKMVV